MITSNINSSEKRERNGLTSYFLLDRRSEGEPNLAVTWVTVAPGGRQIPHHHAPEQVYVVVQGHGEMRVGAETRTVRAGELVYIPANAEHGIVNTGEETLAYVSAATPPFDLTEGYDRGQLQLDRYS